MLAVGGFATTALSRAAARPRAVRAPRAVSASAPGAGTGGGRFAKRECGRGDRVVARGKKEDAAKRALMGALGGSADILKENDGDGSQRDMLACLELNPDQHYELAAYCRECGIDFLSTAFGLNELELLLDLKIRAIKVPSGEITHRPLLEAMATNAANGQLPVYLSTGMSTLGEVEAALEIFLKAGLSRDSITLLHCLSAYPAPEGEINLRAISTLASAFGCPVGYSDHTLGITAPVAAVALGAVVIEKHLTLDCGMEGPDHRASLEPDQFAAMVQGIRGIERALGDGLKRPTASERVNLPIVRKSIVAARTIQEGEVFSAWNITAKRPGTGISPMHWDELLGRTASRAYSPDELIEW